MPTYLLSASSCEKPYLPCQYYILSLKLQYDDQRTKSKLGKETELNCQKPVLNISIGILSNSIC